MNSIKMSKSICVRIELKPDSMDRVKNWAKVLNERAEEVKKTLLDETIELEAVFLDQINGVDYLIYYIRVQNEQQAKQSVQNSQHAIDAFHQAFKKECWVKAVRLENLIDISVK